MESRRSRLASQVKHAEHREQRFSLRKFSFGTASILVGSLLFLGPAVSADDLNNLVPEVNSAEASSNYLDEATPAIAAEATEEVKKVEEVKVNTEALRVVTVEAEQLRASSSYVNATDSTCRIYLSRRLR